MRFAGLCLRDQAGLGAQLPVWKQPGHRARRKPNACVGLLRPLCHLLLLLYFIQLRSHFGDSKT